MLRPSFQGGRTLASTAFQYDTDFLARADRYELSPDLPLVSSIQYAPEGQALFGAFADAAPDDWGERIIEAHHASRARRDSSLPRAIGKFDFLIGVADQTRMGALRLQAAEGGDWLSSDAGVANLHDLARILEAAGRYETGEATDEDVAYLNDVATSPGGARPKANVVAPNGRLAIAKLPHSKDGNSDVEGWEALALTLAGNAGLRTPAWSLERVGREKSVLISERFDRAEKNVRVGYISARTALGLGIYDGDRTTYEEFTDTLAELSVNPRVDLHEMFGRVALNVLIRNVDDHWRNHGFLRAGNGWRLAPVFDLNPVPRRRGGAIFARPISREDDPRDRDLRVLLKIADSFQLSQDAAYAVLHRVADAVAGWPRVADDLGIAQAQRDAMADAFDVAQLDYVRALPGGSMPGA
ncbi:type II toxin-antitoxin system HipA family toxin [Homoserinibacter sp. GY 40078]|uniref:type II toxin-antitoxin system HipA family toxin n=1 Tax=Homoserinibacter sp. GY 40078 TaxID=2603275 RepID=UPI0011C996E3|nr:HipA domain-containing protein [Homoserinibacter sp. GY 40078]TXK18434.1 type II toxin-antitoxin system HipA family toxin [Homoserinibacter sp. GY 40078]